MITNKDLLEGIAVSTLYFFLLTLFTGEVNQSAPFWFFGGYMVGSAIINTVRWATGRGTETAILQPKAKHKKIGFIWIYRVETLKGKKLTIITNKPLTPTVSNMKRVTNHLFTRFI